MSKEGADDVEKADRKVFATKTPLQRELAVDTPVPGTTGTNTFNPSIATDGTNYLVVWSDARNGTETDIWGVRVDASGAVLDPTGIKIAAGAGNQSKPVVAFTGGTYVVAWEDYKVTGGSEADIAAAMVSTTGAVTPVPAAATSFSSETAPAFASRGNNALLTWQVNGQIQGAIFDPSLGTFGTFFAVTSGTNAHKDSAVAADPSGNYLVVFTETTTTSSDDTRGQLVAPTGALSGAVFNISNGAGQQSNASASFDGTNFDVVWSSNDNGVDIYGTRVTTAGAILDAHLENTTAFGGKVINKAANNQETPTIACSASGCFVAWQDKRNSASTVTDIYGQALTTGFRCRIC